MSDSDDLRPPADPAAVPAPASYSFDLPAFEASDGIPLGKINPDDPLAKAAATYAREHNLTQQQFSSLLKVYADHAVSEAQAYRKWIAQEGRKLGPNAAARGQAVKSWLTDRLGPELAADLTQHFRTARHVEAFERLRGDARAAPHTIEQRWYGTR